MKKENKARRYADDASLTAKELKSARSINKVEKTLLSAIKKSSRGRPAGRSKEAVHLSLDIDLVRAMRRTGRGWQTRVNAILRKSMNLPTHHQNAK